MNSYAYGANVKTWVIFRDPDTGAYVDPTTVTFLIRTPETGAITTWVYLGAGSIVKDSVGHYRAAYTCSFPGEWYYRWEGAGAYIGAYEKYFCIMETMFA